MNSFRDWLIASGISKNTAESINSRINRINKVYLLEYEFNRDHCASILKDFTYTADDASNGLLPNVNIDIKGDYVAGLRSLKNALVLFVEYLTETQPTVTQFDDLSTFNTCTIDCNFSFFNKFTGPMWCKKVQNMTKSTRNKMAVCECCQQTRRLDAAHRRHLSRLDIIKKILDENYKIGCDLYKVDLVEFEKKFIEAHKPFNETFYFLCRECHDKYDSNDLEESNEVVEKIITNKKGDYTKDER